MNGSYFFENWYRLTNKFNQKNKQARTYGTEHTLFPSEAHMIEVIGTHGKINTTGLARALAVTKGAVSQMTGKLLAKGLIKKTPAPSGGKEMFIALTDAGLRVYDGHRALHSKMTARVESVLGELTQEQLEAVERLFDALDQSLDEME